MASAVASSAISTTFFSAAAAAASSSSSSSSSFAAKPLNVLGLPTLRRNLKVSCSSARDHPRDGVSSSSSSSSASASASTALSGLMMASSSSWLLLAAASQQPAMALVDERLSTEGTGLSLGLSNPLLIWILLGVATLVWALYFTYSSSLPEGDDDSGLAL